MAREKQKPMLYRTGLSHAVWCAVRWKDLGGGHFEALEKFDVTDDFYDLAERLFDELMDRRAARIDGQDA